VNTQFKPVGFLKPDRLFAKLQYILPGFCKRNFERFPEDFMFRQTGIEFENLKSQIATSNSWNIKTV